MCHALVYAGSVHICEACCLLLQATLASTLGVHVGVHSLRNLLNQTPSKVGSPFSPMSLCGLGLCAYRVKCLPVLAALGSWAIAARLRMCLSAQQIISRLHASRFVTCGLAWLMCIILFRTFLGLLCTSLTWLTWPPCMFSQSAACFCCICVLQSV